VNGDAGSGDGAASRVVVAGGVALALALAVPALAAVVKGTPGPDRLVGTERSDLLVGNKGRDVLIGKGRGDTLRAGRGADRLRPGPGEDVAKAGRGPDLVKARDGEPDLIDCGLGDDTAIVDEIEDGVLDCEEVIGP